ncbi:unnamed protein product, partial [Ixodes hexagonus]
QAERELVRDLCDRKAFSAHALVAHNVHKWFGSLHAVRGLSFAVVRGECFGLLGVNGAGKTTTFQVLAALEQMTDGDAYMEEGTLSEDPRKILTIFGWGLRERQEAIADRGDVAKGVRAALDQFESRLLKVQCEHGLLPNRSDKIAKVVQTRPSHSWAHTGRFFLLFYTEFLKEGGDSYVNALVQVRLVAVRQARATWSCLAQLKQQRSRCELACDRIGIMVDGQFRCLGSLQHLKAKFGTGYTLSLRLEGGLAAVDVNAFLEAVQQLFPGIELRDHHEVHYSPRN